MKRILSLILTTFLFFPSFAQESFDPLSMDVISNNHVTAFAMDEDGYMWIGTSLGLNRYNGSVFRKFYASGDSGALINDKITSLLADSDGRLWVGTEAGIHLFRNGKAERLPEGVPYIPSSLLPYDENTILASCNGGLIAYDKGSGSTRMVSDEASVSSSSHIACGLDGNVWVAGNNCSVTVLDRSFVIAARIPLPGNAISGLCATLEGDIVASTDKGLFLIDGTALKQKPLPKGLDKLCQGKNVLFAAHDPKYSNVVIGIAGEGFYSLSIGKDEAVKIWKMESLEACSAAIFLACTNNMWLSKNSDGFTMIPRTRGMVYQSLEGQGRISRLHATEGGKLLVITDMRVLLSDDGLTDITPAGIKGSAISQSLLSGDALWLLTNDVLLAYRLNGSSLSPIATFPCKNGSQLMEISPGAVVVTMESGRLVCTSEGKSSFALADKLPKFTGTSHAADGGHYLFTQDAVWLMHKDLRTEILVSNVPIPVCACKDRTGNLWVGTQNSGVWVFDSAMKRTSTFNMDNGLADNAIMSIDMDWDGDIWVVSRTSICCILPDTGKSTMVVRRSSYPSEFIRDGVVLHTDGKITMAGVNGFITIEGLGADWPHEIKMELDGLVAGKRVLGCPPEGLVLEHRENSPVFFISGSDSQFDSNPIYEYMLKGRDREWRYAGNYRRIAYSSLPGGRYSFMARVSSADGSLTSDTLCYSFRVKPSPWLSWPAMSLYFLIFCALLLGLHRGIRERRHSREQLEKAALEKAITERLVKEKADFFTNVSHEFRTPLSLIYSPSKELLEMGDKLPPRARELAESIDRNAERMYKLTGQLLAFNRAGSRQEGLAVARISLSKRLESLVNDFSYLFDDRHITLSREIQGNIVGWCDSEKFERIVFNLISNAAKYTPPESGSVCVRLHRDGDLAIVEVADTGIGISDEDKRRIFGRYERAGDESMTIGFGIGLHFAQHLAQLHKGELTVRDNEPKGSVFRFSFPLSIEAYDDAEIWSDDKEESNEEQNETPALRGKSKLLLVVEDNDQMRHYVAGMLREDYDVMTAANGVKALQRMETTMPDLVVSDVMMPEMDGIHLLGSIKGSEDYCHIPVVMLSAKADIESRLQAVNAGADAYLPKPFEKRYLQAVVRNIFDNLSRLQSKLSASPEAVADEPALSPKDRVFVDRVYAYLEKHVGDNGLSVNELCTAVGISRTSVWSKVQTLFGVSPQALILNYRMNKAMELLKAGEMNVSEVGYSVGFSSPSTFSRAFRAKFGMAPSSVLRGNDG